ncbi:MAG: zinc-dependent metalloprotease [Bacteroidota bacterium]|nr:zinc-dependent metalloprotease [Bacteroidota bacterium]
MRKFLFLSVLFFGAVCSNAQNQPRLGCATDIEWQEQVKRSPELLQMQKQFEDGFAKIKETYNPEDYKVKNGLGKKAAKYIIPVVVHIFHANGSENLSDATVTNVIANMNKYFSGTINNIGSVRAPFKSLIADCEFEFRLARKDPEGNCTNGIVRVYTPETYKGNDIIKALSVWDTKRYLNIWVCNSVYSGTTQVGGYAYLPFGGGLSSKSGVILVASGFVGDNTAAHEVGHWLGLFHPFQSNDSCSASNDEIDDTPPVYFKPPTTGGVLIGRGNLCGNPTYNTCTSTSLPDKIDYPDMQENVMDYFSGSCSGLMFTLQQKARMIYCMETFRPQLISQENLVATGTDVASVSDCAPIAAFNTKTQTICAGSSVAFIDFSYNAAGINTWSWEFEGGNPSTYSGKTPPAIVYANAGTYPVKLTATNTKGSGTTTFTNYINVLPANSAKLPGWRATADWWYLNNWQQEGWKFDYQFSSNRFARVNTSYDNNASMMLPQDPYNQKNSVSNEFTLISPSFNFENTSNPYIAFNYAFARGTMFNAPTEESLILYTSSDCGKTWNLRASHSLANVSSIGATTTLASTINFEPSEKAKWNEMVYKSSTFPKTPNLMFKIVFTYKGGNNFYLDNVRAGDGASSGIRSQSASETSLMVYPNPFSGTATLTYELKKNQSISIQLFDLLGKEMCNLYEGLQIAGNQSILIDNSKLNLKGGVYFIKLSTHDNSVTQKIIIE